MMKWIVFAVLWIPGLFAGGMWMLVCLGAKECIAGYQEAKARSKTPNVRGKAETTAPPA